ncbi:MAG TPA: hypothetical protein VK826_17225 [Bacteroidia bacterium]|nr:hypothetical protein [Bacteroidia bacterium]
MNQYDKFYSRKNVHELLEQLYGHKSGLSPIDKSWFDALITYLSALQLEEKEKVLLGEILSSDAKLLNNNRVNIQKRLDELKATEEFNNPLVINPAYIVEAGLALKRLVVVIIISLVIFVVAFVLLNLAHDYNDKSTAYNLFVFGGLIGNAVALILLYRAGNKLSSSVTRQHRQ